MRKLIVKYNMNLYHLSRDSFVSHLYKAPPNIVWVCINKENLEANKSMLRGLVKKWEKNLRRGAEGLFAVYDNRIVGYGWLKKQGSKDTFYRMGRGVAYLSEFFVENDFRGKGICPSMMSQFILSHPEYQNFFVSAYTSNHSSIKSLLKVGFSKVRSLTFVRALKITFNKYKIVEPSRRVQ